MSDKRKPLLSDGALTAIIDKWVEYDDGLDTDWDKASNAADSVRNFYETLIATGKLRVVREVEAMCGDHGGIEGCSCSECSAPVMPEAWMYCPGCGNKVRR